MRIIVKAKAGSKKESVERMTQPGIVFPGEQRQPDTYKVSVTAPPVDGRANEAIAKALARHFDVAPSRVRLLSGQASKRKTFEIDTES